MSKRTSGVCTAHIPFYYQPCLVHSIFSSSFCILPCFLFIYYFNQLRLLLHNFHQDLLFCFLIMLLLWLKSNKSKHPILYTNHRFLKRVHTQICSSLFSCIVSTVLWLLFLFEGNDIFICIFNIFI